MSKFLVVDNVLSANELESTKEFFQDLDSGKTVWIDKIQQVNFPLQKILDLVGESFDLSTMVGCECWSHVNTGTTWHVDKDEKLWTEQREIKYPLCSIVYYPHIRNMQGGKFMTKTHLALPITNRLVAFSPGLYHSVEKFMGERMACAINPWSYKLQV